jgi:hypothetical protein
MAENKTKPTLMSGRYLEFVRLFEIAFGRASCKWPRNLVTL